MTCIISLNHSQFISIHFILYVHTAQCTYMTVTILIKTIILLQFYCHPEKISGKHFVQAYMHSAHQSERKAGKKEQKKTSTVSFPVFKLLI